MLKTNDELDIAELEETIKSLKKKIEKLKEENDLLYFRLQLTESLVRENTSISPTNLSKIEK